MLHHSSLAAAGQPGAREAIFLSRGRVALRPPLRVPHTTIVFPRDEVKDNSRRPAATRR